MAKRSQRTKYRENYSAQEENVHALFPGRAWSPHDRDQENRDRRYEWRHDRAYGYFTPVREFRRGDMRCREFTETSFTPDGRNFTRTGTACRQGDGNWRFD